MRTAIIIAILFAAPAAYADDDGPNNDEIWVGGGARALHSRSANALTSDSLAGSTLGYARDLGLDLVPGLSIWAEGGMLVGTAQGTMFHTMTTLTSSAGLTAGLRVRYPVFRRVVATAHADLGVQNASVELTEGSITERDNGWGAMGDAAAGIELYALDHPPFGLALRLEYGYVVTQGVRLTPHRDDGDDTLKLPISESSIGTLDLGGQMFTVSVSGQF